MSAPLDGQTPKYHVTKANGKPVDPDARYLTLRIDTKPDDSPERLALGAYLRALEESGDAALAWHLRQFYGIPDEPREGA